MAIRKIVNVGDDILRKKSREVCSFDKKLAELLGDMAQTMYLNDGVGLAAPQVGILKRVAVVDIGDEGNGLIEFVNPEIVFSSGSEVGSEGCLSIPGAKGNVCRPSKIIVRAFDRSGAEFTLEACGFLARAVCHELDHLDGILFTDKLESSKK